VQAYIQWILEKHRISEKLKVWIILQAISVTTTFGADNQQAHHVKKV